MIKAGIIGLGYWGPNLLRNFCKNPNIEVVMAADPRPEARGSLQGQYPSVRYVEDGMAVINDPEVAAVAIATPVHTHYPLAKAALEAGKHVPSFWSSERSIRLRSKEGNREEQKGTVSSILRPRTIFQ